MSATTIPSFSIKDDGVPLTPALTPSSISACTLFLNRPSAMQVLKDFTFKPICFAIEALVGAFPAGGVGDDPLPLSKIAPAIITPAIIIAPTIWLWLFWSLG